MNGFEAFASSNNALGALLGLVLILLLCALGNILASIYNKKFAGSIKTDNTNLTIKPTTVVIPTRCCRRLLSLKQEQELLPLIYRVLRRFETQQRFTFQDIYYSINPANYWKYPCLGKKTIRNGLHLLAERGELQRFPIYVSLGRRSYRSGKGFRSRRQGYEFTKVD